MTIEQITNVVEHRIPVKYKDGKYYVTAVISRYGRQPYQTHGTPKGWWYQLELSDVKIDNGINAYRSSSLVYARIEEIESEE